MINAIKFKRDGVMSGTSIKWEGSGWGVPLQKSIWFSIRLMSFMIADN